MAVFLLQEVFKDLAEHLRIDIDILIERRRFGNGEIISPQEIKEGLELLVRNQRMLKWITFKKGFARLKESAIQIRNFKPLSADPFILAGGVEPIKEKRF